MATGILFGRKERLGDTPANVLFGGDTSGVNLSPFGSLAGVNSRFSGGSASGDPERDALDRAIAQAQLRKLQLDPNMEARRIRLAELGLDETKRGNNLQFDASMAGQATTRRGQDLGYKASKEQNDTSILQSMFGNVTQAGADVDKLAQIFKAAGHPEVMEGLKADHFEKAIKPKVEGAFKEYRDAMSRGDAKGAQSLHDDISQNPELAQPFLQLVQQATAEDEQKNARAADVPGTIQYIQRQAGGASAPTQLDRNPAATSTPAAPAITPGQYPQWLQDLSDRSAAGKEERFLTPAMLPILKLLLHKGAPNNVNLR